MLFWKKLFRYLAEKHCSKSKGAEVLGARGKLGPKARIYSIFISYKRLKQHFLIPKITIALQCHIFNYNLHSRVNSIYKYNLLILFISITC